MQTDIRFIFVLMLFGFAACAYGPKRENDTVLDKLNGASYQSASPTAVGIPTAFKRAVAFKNIRGQLTLDAKPLPVELKYQTIILLQKDRELGRTMTDAQGQFRINGDFPNGDYTLRVLSEKYSASQDLRIDRDSLDGVQIKAKALRP